MDEAQQLHDRIGGVTYPTTKAELITAAREGGADAALLRHLENIEDVTYADEDEVSAAVTYLGETTIRYGHVTVYDQ
ncbi:DUF2795 domain-containing protein [Actinotalea sp. Marseille-Q4924]|uniref:DUF2795 domain-containing protein n=1 Tax=Actinotalea sp. Marseille-Q4924 TaxID=2866571 RepID=UPI001CE478A8|nr:DUF2795 domain-containing protein [Actinotalea sp. Marseille-Q4924]